MKNNNQISASEFKKHFLSLVDEVKTKHSSFVITKRKIPMARVVPLDNNTKDIKSYFGFMRGAITIKDDIVNYSSEKLSGSETLCYIPNEKLITSRITRPK